MNFFQRFTFLFSAPMFDADDLEGLRVNQIITAIERMGFQVIKARRVEDAEIAVQTDAAIGLLVVDWGKKGIEGKAASLINLMRRRGLDMPIVILVRRKRFEDIPVEVLDFIDGYVFLAEETPEFIAKNLVSRLKQYAETLKTPFFGALVDYAEEGNQLWTCPGHNGGIFYSRSPIGRIFMEHLGEAVFRDDLDNSILELGDLLTHEGPGAAGAEGGGGDLRGGKDLFRAQRHLLVQQDRADQPRRRGRPRAVRPQQPQGGPPGRAPDGRRHPDLSLDRPQRLRPDRPDPAGGTRGESDPRAHPRPIRWSRITEAWKRERPFRVAVIEQCTYDGTIYDAQRIVERIGRLCDYIMFDEAWAGFMKFHPIYERRFAMGLTGLDENSPGIVATQSTHKQLASFSQASQIHRARPAHQGAAPAGGASPLQRRLHAVRLDLAVLSAVRLARRRRADDEGPIGRSAVGRHHPVSASNCARSCARSGANSRRRSAIRRGAGSSIRSCPTACRSATRR